VKLRFDAFCIWVSGCVPYCRYRDTLKDNDKENSNGLQCSESDEGIHGCSDTLSLFSETQYEDEDGAFDQGENGIVKDLRDVEPPEAGCGIVVGRDVFLVPPKVAEFDIYQNICQLMFVGDSPAINVALHM
jgi:hypothetical protein